MSFTQASQELDRICTCTPHRDNPALQDQMTLGSPHAYSVPNFPTEALDETPQKVLLVINSARNATRKSGNPMSSLLSTRDGCARVEVAVRIRLKTTHGSARIDRIPQKLRTIGGKLVVRDITTPQSLFVPAAQSRPREI
jgi:hypothetical protein